jgi:hypothetical protein
MKAGPGFMMAVAWITLIAGAPGAAFAADANEKPNAPWPPALAVCNDRSASEPLKALCHLGGSAGDATFECNAPKPFLSCGTDTQWACEYDGPAGKKPPPITYRASFQWKGGPIKPGEMIDTTGMKPEGTVRGVEIVETIPEASGEAGAEKAKAYGERFTAWGCTEDGHGASSRRFECGTWRAAVSYHEIIHELSVEAVVPDAAACVGSAFYEPPRPSSPRGSGTCTDVFVSPNGPDRVAEIGVWRAKPYWIATRVDAASNQTVSDLQILAAAGAAPSRLATNVAVTAVGAEGLYWLTTDGAVSMLGALDGSAKEVGKFTQLGEISFATDVRDVYLAVWEDLLGKASAKKGGIWRLPKAGGTPELIASDLGSSVRGWFAVDDEAFYWQPGFDNAILRHPKSDAHSTRVIEEERGLGSFAVDGDQLYWTDGNGDLKRGPRRGGGAELVAHSQTSVGSIAVTQTRIYWTSRSTIYAFEKPKGPVTSYATASALLPAQVVADADTVYWTDGLRVTACPAALW